MLMEESPVVPVPAAVMAKHDATTQHLLNIALATNARYANHPGRIVDDGFRLALEEHHFESYRRPSPSSKHDDFLVIGVITAKLDDIGYALYADTSQASRTINSFLYGSEVVGGGILHTHTAKSPSDPYRFLGVKHSLYHLLSPTIFKPREAVFIESMGSTTVDGQPALYMIRKSVDLPEYLGAPGCVRMDVQVVYLFIALPSGHVRYFHTMLSDLHGNFPAWMANKRSTKLFQVMSTLNQLAQIRRLVAAPEVAPAALVAPRSRQKCGVCPTVTKKWRWCRTCGQITCTECAFHVSKPWHLVRAAQVRPTITASSSAYTKQRRTSVASSSSSGSSRGVSRHVNEDYCKKCFHKARNPQAFKPQVLYGCDLSGEFSDLVQDVPTPSRSARASSSARAHAQGPPFRAESGDVYTPLASTASSTASSKGFRTPKTCVSRAAHGGFGTPRHNKKLERTGSEGQLVRNAPPDSTEKLLPLEESAVEFNPNLFESLEYQRKLLADMQALLVSANSSPRHTPTNPAGAAMSA